MTGDRLGSPTRFLPYTLIATAAFLVFAALSIVLDLVEWHLLARHHDNETYWDAFSRELDLLYQVSLPLGLAQVATFVIAIVFNVVWLHRAGAATKALSHNPDRPPANRAWLWFCIPFANFHKPFFSMRDIYTFAVERDDSMKLGGPGWLSLHWALWIFGGIGIWVLSKQFDAALLRVGQARQLLLAINAFDLLSLGAGLLFVRDMITVSAGLPERTV